MNCPRRQFLASTAAISLGAITSVSGTAAGQDGDYDIITVGAGETFQKQLSDGETWANKLIDITADRAKFDITSQGNPCTLRNIGVRGQWDETFLESPIAVWTDNADDEVIVENIYFADGSYATEGNNGPTGIYVPAEHAGTVTIRTLNAQGIAAGAVHAAEPGGPDGAGGDVVVENSYAATLGPAAYRLGTDESIAENCVAVETNVGGWARHNSPTFRDCDFSENGHSDVFGGSAANRDDAGGTAVLEKVRGETTSGSVEGSLTGAAQRTEPDEVTGVPLTPEEAAAGSGADGDRPAHDLHVTVQNQSGDAVSNAEVSVEGQSDNTAKSDTAAEDGTLRFRDLAEGRYTVTAQPAPTKDDGSDDDPDNGDSDPSNLAKVDYTEYGSSGEIYEQWAGTADRHQFTDDPTGTGDRVLEIPFGQGVAHAGNSALYLDNPDLGLDTNQHGRVKRVYQRFKMYLPEDFSLPNPNTLRFMISGMSHSNGQAHSGGGVPDGTNGWGTRPFISRRDADDGTPMPTDGWHVADYTYHMDQSGASAGDSAVFGNVAVPSGKWVTWETEVTANTWSGSSANADGQVRCWVDGELAYDIDGFRWTTDPSNLIELVALKGYYWPGDEGSPKAQSLYFKDHAVSTERREAIVSAGQSATREGRVDVYLDGDDEVVVTLGEDNVDNKDDGPDDGDESPDDSPDDTPDDTPDDEPDDGDDDTGSPFEGDELFDALFGEGGLFDSLFGSSGLLDRLVNT